LRVAGDLAVAVGAIPAYVSAFWLVPVILPAAAVAIGALADAAGVRVRLPAQPADRVGFVPLAVGRGACRRHPSHDV
jgi:hypothetical protein